MNHPLSRLIARYGRDQGLYLYGEYAALLSLGYETFAARHPVDVLVRLEALLAPLSLWPAPSLAPTSQALDAPPDQPGVEGSPDAVLAGLSRPPLAWVAGTDLYDREADWAQAAAAASGSWFEAARRSLTLHWGLPLPTMAVLHDPALPVQAYRLEMGGEAVLYGEAFPGLDQVIHPGAEPPPPLPYPWSPDPTGPGSVAWMPIGRAALPPAGCERLHWLAAVARHVAWGVDRHIHRMVGPQALYLLLEEARRQGLDGELLRYVSASELQRVFRTLLAQRLPLRGLGTAYDVLLREILTDLGTRTLTPLDAEQLGRQLPLFPTERLVGIIRRAWGLPASPPDPPERSLA